jgi:ATP-dependent RNA helicase RhlE
MPWGVPPLAVPGLERPGYGTFVAPRLPNRFSNTAGPREEKAKPVRENHAPVAPPPPPPVPEGPYPPNWEVLGLSPAVLAAVRETGYEKPTTIQEKSIPIILTGRDVVGASQTGTGKTAAFALPTITRLGPPGKFRCLVLEPVRELAAQVVEQFEKYGKHTGLRVLLVHGGVGYEKQRKGLQQGVDVVVATPGRLLDFMQEGIADLRDVEVLILDEVDRMLDMGFLPDVRRIVEKTPSARQTLFSQRHHAAADQEPRGFRAEGPRKRRSRHPLLRRGDRQPLHVSGRQRSA